MGDNDYDGLRDRIGLRKDHRLKEELCRGKNRDLVSGPCPQLDDKTGLCETLRDHDGQTLKKAPCALPLVLMATNDVWKANRLIQQEVDVSSVLESLTRARLEKPRIESLYKWIATVVWRIAEYAAQGRTRRVCGNCIQFLRHPQTCGIGARKNANADDTSCERFEYRDKTTMGETELPPDIGVETIGKAEAVIDARGLLAKLRRRVQGAPDPGTSRIYRRQLELIERVLQEEASSTEAVRFFKDEWRVSDQTVRNDFSAVRKLLQEHHGGNHEDDPHRKRRN